MSFNSTQYLLFLPVVFLVFQWIDDRYRWLVLLVASYGFYAAFKAPQLPIALALVTAISYVSGVRLGTTGDEGRRKLIFWLGVSGCLLILAIVKYLPLALATGGADNPYANLAVSVGISYFTFQGISYLADVSMGIQEPERHLGHLALSLAFFPKLLQGPIERAGDLLPQIKEPYRFDYETVRSGMLLFAWGLFKKVVVADRLALFVNPVYDHVHAYTGLPLVLATYIYAFQLYFDFSGYTDMVLGTARLFNIRLTRNFNSPYLAVSVADFWRRWHISFSRWLLDYLFMPLQMQFRRWRTGGLVLALLLTFLACGLWHGARGTFIIWGALHGVYMAVSAVSGPLRKDFRERWATRIPGILKIVQTAFTFQLVCFAWIFFRANTVGDALYVVTHLFSGVAGVGTFLLAQGSRNLLIAIASLLIVTGASSLDDDAIAGRKLRERPLYVRWSAYYLLLASLIVFVADQQGQFIYFQF